MTLKTTPNATSSPESAAGQLRLDSPDGQMTGQCGQEAALASPLVAQESAKDRRMKEISGRYGSGSLQSANLQSCLESRLRVRLPTAGGMAWPQIWKAKVTPALRQYCQLAVSGKPIEGKDYGMWGTPRAQERPRSEEYAKGRQMTPSEIAKAVQRGLWATPDCSDRRGVNSGQVGLSNQAKALIGLSAPMAKLAPLNPAFPCWLMGYSEEHLSSMLLAMRSFRKSRRNLSRRPCENTTEKGDV